MRTTSGWDHRRRPAFRSEARMFRNHAWTAPGPRSGGEAAFTVLRNHHSADEIEIRLTDDGAGAGSAQAPDSGGHGLSGMRERSRSSEAGSAPAGCPLEASSCARTCPSSRSPDAHAGARRRRPRGGPVQLPPAARCTGGHRGGRRGGEWTGGGRGEPPPAGCRAHGHHDAGARRHRGDPPAASSASPAGSSF